MDKEDVYYEAPQKDITKSTAYLFTRHSDCYNKVQTFFRKRKRFLKNNNYDTWALLWKKELEYIIACKKKDARDIKYIPILISIIGIFSGLLIEKNIFLSIVEIYIKIFILLLLFLILCGILCHRKITFLIDIASFELEAVKAKIQESKKPCHSLSVASSKPEYNPSKCLIIRVSGRHNKHFDF
ncbi:MAG: hypothetical protein VB035_14540 [Candidatus Fimivivens sp.]|nr:hypothetical protein [Candidatus Fimivivens sp.]